ncbi:MAG: MarR family transcriptional regulator [Ignavibacteriae bacterium]|nr:MarR family transcriptional regulator [Ignavibacteriota bacterium]MCB9208293.1 MarR family transcriptional regulator [Ignavibacteriales bacterium]MCB9259055.1 MarR family transcriptional regulator [Ignavibacteriales bacterium]
MKLEEEIKQRKFKTDYQKLAVNIMFTHGWLITFQKKIFDKYGITGTQYNILRILRGQHPESVSVNTLRERMLDKMSDTSRLVERLRLKKLLIRNICQNDRRKSDINITEKGLQLLKELDTIDSEFENLFNTLSLSEVETLNNLLDKMRG